MSDVTVVFMVYRSPRYYDFVADQLSRYELDCSATIMCFANDPMPELEEHLKRNRHPGFRTVVRNSRRPRENPLQDVYGAWNMAVLAAETELVCLVNSDMAFSDFWLDPLLTAHHAGYLPTSRLVESGNLDSPEGVESMPQFGQTLSEFKQAEWEAFAESERLKAVGPEQTIDGQLFMPVVFDRKEFLELGGYGNNVNRIVPIPGGRGYQNEVHSGDRLFFDMMTRIKGRKHVTVRNSMCYHLQEGELRGRE
jgi:hypothetical protein